MATRGGSAPGGAQVVDPAGAGDRWLPVGVGGHTGWSRDVREAAAEKGGSSAPAGPHPPAPPGAPTRREAQWLGKEQLSEAGPRHPSQVEAKGAGVPPGPLTGQRRPPC